MQNSIAFLLSTESDPLVAPYRSAEFWRPDVQSQVPSERGSDSRPLELKSPKTKPLKRTFHPFLGLPQELREIIWKAALPGPRIVNLEIEHGAGPRLVRISFPGTSLVAGGYSGRVNEAISTPRPTGLLYACRESRSVALKSYDRCFSFKSFPRALTTTDDGSPISEDEIESPGVFFQPALDTVYIPHHTGRCGMTELLQDTTYQELRIGPIKSIAMHAEFLLKEITWGCCFQNRSWVLPDPTKPTKFTEGGPPWLEGIEQLIVIAEFHQSNTKVVIEDRLRISSVLSRLPEVDVYSLADFRSLPRWKSI